jgi:hypothetical protein
VAVFFGGEDYVGIKGVAEDLGNLFQSVLDVAAHCWGDFILSAGELNVHSLRSLLDLTWDRRLIYPIRCCGLLQFSAFLRAACPLAAPTL